MPSNAEEIVIIGGGLSGLTAALTLHRAGRRALILEATDRIGGRVKTDRVDGFLLDRGFQVFQDSYPTARKWLDLKALDLKPFRNGCILRGDRATSHIADPWRAPLQALRGLLSPPGSYFDLLKVAAFRRRVLRSPDPYECLTAPQTSALQRLKQSGFSEAMINEFFKAFFGNVFLEKELNTSSRMLDFVFRMFSQGSATLPAGGMEAIPRQLADQLPHSHIRTHSSVATIEDKYIILDNGEQINAKHIIVALEMPAANRLLKIDQTYSFRQTNCTYFEAPHAPFAAPILMLNRDPGGPIDSLCCPSNVQSSYAPKNRALISVSSIQNQPTDLELWLADIRNQLRAWFGSQVDRWRHLSTYHIPYSLPDQSCNSMEPVRKPARIKPGVYRCGDYCDTRSIDGAMASGERAALAVLEDLK